MQPSPPTLHDHSALRSNQIIPHTLHVERVIYVIAFMLKRQLMVTQTVIFTGGI